MNVQYECDNVFPNLKRVSEPLFIEKHWCWYVISFRIGPTYILAKNAPKAITLET